MNSAASLADWMLIPGHMCDARMWCGIRPALEQAGAKTIDADLSQDDSIDGMARRALLLIDRPSVVVGFSMGGMVALRMCALAPHRIAGLVLVSSNARPDLPERSEMRLRQQREAGEGGLRRIIADEMSPHYFAINRTSDDELVCAMADALGPDVFVQQSEAIRLRPDARETASAIGKPTLIVGGAQDAMSLPDWQREMAAAIPTAELILLEGVAHFVPLEAAPALRQSILDWAQFHNLLAQAARG